MENIARLEAQLQSQGEMLSQLTSEADARDKELQQATRNEQDAKDRNKKLVTEKNQLRRKAETLTSDRDAIVSQRDLLNEDVRRLQQTSFGSLDDARWMPLATSAIVGEFSKVRKAINNLAKSNAGEDFDSLEQMPEDYLSTLFDQLRSIVRFKSPNINGLKELVAIRHAPRLCLSGIISNVVHKKFIDRPFFLLEMDMEARNIADEHSKLLAGGLRDLSALQSAFSQYDEKKSHLWRSDTLRLLNPLHLRGTEHGQKQLEHIQDLIESIARSLAENFVQLTGLLRTMDDAELRKFLNDLAQLFVQAGQLSLKLWCQRPAYRCQYLDDLSEQPFLTSSQVLHPHPLHKHSDPLDTALDGKMTKILVHPAILSYGTHEAENYHQSQILEKAVIWLDV